MADNLGYNPGTVSDVAADDISSVFFQRVKLTLGADGVNDGDVSTANALPIELSLPSAARTTQASLSFAASGDNTIVTATASQTTRVHRIWFVSAAPVDVIFKSAATALTGTLSMSGRSTLMLDMSTEPWFVTGTNEALIINLSAAVQCSGRIYYTKSA